MKIRRLAWIILPITILSIWAIWTYLILDSKYLLSKIAITGENDPYSRLGPLGDSFGPIASLMATIAAAGALSAFINDRRDRRLQQFESNFYTLLSTFESITKQIEVKYGKIEFTPDNIGTYEPLRDASSRKIEREFNGRSALRIIVYLIRSGIKVGGYRDVKRVCNSYERIFNKYVDHLGHYFRTLHHIFRLIDERCEGDKMYYSRIIRANFSNTELCLIAYNCIVGEGRFKFRELAIKYSLFHNLHRRDLGDYETAELAFFKRKLPDTAFRFEEYPDITYDD